MKKKSIIFATAIMLIMSLSLFACGDKGTKYKVTLMDGATELTVLQVSAGSKLTIAEDGTINGYKPQKTGYTFIGWYATPLFTRAFNANTAIEADTTLFALFKAPHQVDDRPWLIAGTGAGAVLFTSDWGRGAVTDAHKFANESTATENIYTMTLDLWAGDQFQVATLTGTTFNLQRGFYYIQNQAGTNFRNRGGIYAENSHTSNIEVLKDGNYKLTFKTNPGDDFNNDINQNVNAFDRIEAERLGDPVDEKVATSTEYYIKGSGITSWNDIFSSFHKTNIIQVNKVYEMEIWLKANEQFMFMSAAVNLADPEAATLYNGANLNFTHVDDASKALFTGASGGGTSGDLKANASGLYKFTLTIADTHTNSKISATVDTTVSQTFGKYYINGALNGGIWGTFGNDRAFERDGETDNYILTIDLKEGDEFDIREFAPDATPNNDNDVTRIRHSFLFKSKYFDAANAAQNNLNFKVLQDGTYVITVNAYSKMVTIVPETPEDDEIFLVIGTAVGWDNPLTSSDGNIFSIEAELKAGDQIAVRVYKNGFRQGGGQKTFGKSQLDDYASFDFFTPNEWNLIIAEDHDGTYVITVNLATNKITVAKAA